VFRLVLNTIENNFGTYFFYYLQISNLSTHMIRNVAIVTCNMQECHRHMKNTHILRNNKVD
jgi:hypothetical protein